VVPSNEVIVSYSRLTLDNHFQDPSLLMQGAGGINFQGIFTPAQSSSLASTGLSCACATHSNRKTPEQQLTLEEIWKSIAPLAVSPSMRTRLA